MVNQTCPEPLIRIPYGARTAKSLDILEKSAGRFMEGHNSGRIIETGSRNVKELEGIGEAQSYRYLFLSALSRKGILFKKGEKLTLEAYTNIDYAGSMVDKRSVSGYCMYLGGNLVTWRVKNKMLWLDQVQKLSLDDSWQAGNGKHPFTGLWGNVGKHPCS
ncbi:hypothetical protein CK203_004864 [Vitis vinifera]|uniref:Mitochondrial protein n=1 Tax=Vitis vinifera TaxID=29760 RepID=A0A438KGQ2_VITVI|nr:hypothetical protein CK203_004864 [Vitis vinifera]